MLIIVVMLLLLRQVYGQVTILNLNDGFLIYHHEYFVEPSEASPLNIVIREDGRSVTIPHLLGLDFVGVVKEVGALCQSIQTGDLVTGISQGGAYVEYVTIVEQAVVKLPQDVNVKETAAFPVAAVMDHGLVKPNQKVLIHGGVGHIAIQLAKQAGAYVYTTGAERNTEFKKRLGADGIIN